MATGKIAEVDIDASGVFKYILIKLTVTKDSESCTFNVVRGYGDCSYHADIDDKFSGQLTKMVKNREIKKWGTKVLGGGRIDHDPDRKTIKVYGYSMGYGRADHQVTVDILKRAYSDYAITWSNDGY